MVKAIVYTSNTGATRRYATMLGQRCGLPAYALKGAPLPRGAEVLYMGWIRASSVQGYARAARRFRVAAVCGVGMGPAGSQVPELRQRNKIGDSVPVFTLQGGFDIAKLRGLYRLMMSAALKMVRKGLADKPQRTPDEEDMLEMLLHGADRVRPEALDPLAEWIAGVK